MKFSSVYVTTATHVLNERCPMPVDQSVKVAFSPDYKVGDPDAHSIDDFLDTIGAGGLLDSLVGARRASGPPKPKKMFDPNSEPRVDFAAQAALTALRRAHVEPHQIGPVYHVADLPLPEHNGNPAVDLARVVKLPAGRSPLVTVPGGRQGALDALSFAASHLEHVDRTVHALVSAGDIWPVTKLSNDAPRLNSGAALVLSPDRGSLQVISTATGSNPLALMHHNKATTAIRSGAAALLHRVVTEALTDAGVQRHELAEVITAYSPSSREHHAVLRQIEADPGTTPLNDDPDRFTLHANAVDLLHGLAKYIEQGGARLAGKPVLVVADSGHGTASAAVLKTT